MAEKEGKSVALPVTACDNPSTMNIDATSETRARLTQRLRELNEEIRAYPQPIARCDAQLGGLVEERALIHAEIERLGPSP